MLVKILFNEYDQMYILFFVYNVTKVFEACVEVLGLLGDLIWIWDKLEILIAWAKDGVFQDHIVAGLYIGFMMV